MPSSLRFGRVSNQFCFQLLQSFPSELQIGNGDLPTFGKFVAGLAVQFAPGLGFADANRFG
jgi:hypothetical protein